MLVASHFHDEIVRQAVVAGAVLAVAGVVWREKRPAPCCWPLASWPVTRRLKPGRDSAH